MKRFTKALLTFACAASIVIGIPAFAHADEGDEQEPKPNVISSMMDIDKDVKYKYWLGQNDAAKISNVKVTDIAAHSAKVSFDYELFNVKDLKRLAFIVSVRKYSKIMVTADTLLGRSLSYDESDIDPPDPQDNKTDEDKKKDSENGDYIPKEFNIHFFSDTPGGYVRGLDYYNYDFAKKLPTKKKGHAQVIVTTKPTTTYTNTEGVGYVDGVVRVENGNIKKPIKPFTSTPELIRLIAKQVDSFDGSNRDKAIDIDVSSTYVGLHADYKDGTSIYFNNNAVQVPTFTTTKKDPPSQCSLGKNKKDSNKNGKDGDKETAKNASGKTSGILLMVEHTFKKNPALFIIAVLVVVVLVATCVVTLVRLSLVRKRAIANKAAAGADGTADAEGAANAEGAADTANAEGAADAANASDIAEGGAEVDAAGNGATAVDATEGNTAEGNTAYADLPEGGFDTPADTEATGYPETTANTEATVYTETPGYPETPSTNEQPEA